MAYTTQQATDTLNGYLGLQESRKKYIENTKNRGFVYTLDNGEEIVIFVYPLVHKQDNTKNYFDTRDSGAYERSVAWNYAMKLGLKYFCFGVNDQVDKFVDYAFSLECDERTVEKLSGTKEGVRSGPGNQIIIPNDYVPQQNFERIRNRLGVYISAIKKTALLDYLNYYDNRPYLSENEDKLIESKVENQYEKAAHIISNYISESGFTIPEDRDSIGAVRDEFISRFGVDFLGKCQEEESLSKVFYSAGDNTDSLCYWIEMNKDCRRVFGGISGGSAYKFGLFQNKKSGIWMTGSPQKSVELSEDEAIARGKEIIYALLRGVSVIEKATLNSLEDYEKLDDDLKAAVGDQFYNWAWFHKYYSIMFQDKLSSFHSTDWQKHVLYCFGIKPSDKYYARSGQIAMIQKYAGFVYREFASVFFDKFGGPKSFIRMGTNDDEKSYATEWHQRGVIGLGWKNTGSLELYIAGNDLDKGAIAERLEEEYYREDARTASRKAGELARFYNTNENSIFVAMAGEKLLAFVDGIGAYFYDSSSNMSHLKPGKWHVCFSEDDALPKKSEGKLTSCYELTDEDNLMFLYKKYYYSADEFENADVVIDKEEMMPLRYNTGLESRYDRNRIVFGAPGTGKSYGLKMDSEDLLKETVGYFERVTFHPDYSYTQFVGTYKPTMDADGRSIKYDFVPGPFMRVYVNALKNGRTDNPQPNLLLIEEINRAKVAAVFGEVFQLLDRDDEGVSEYEVQASEDIRRYLMRELNVTEQEVEKIRIPDNMFIWATMNSADQGVFPMDTAFKRRWSFEYLGINENEEEIVGKGKIRLAGSDEPVEWNILRRAINAKMSSNDFKVNEDKLMGPYFLSKNVIDSDDEGNIKNPDRFIQVFKNKVIMYLYEDAVKQGKRRFFEGCDSSKYSSVCEAFDDIGLGIFGPNFAEIFYAQQRDAQ